MLCDTGEPALGQHVLQWLMTSNIEPDSYSGLVERHQGYAIFRALVISLLRDNSGTSAKLVSSVFWICAPESLGSIRSLPDTIPPSCLHDACLFATALRARRIGGRTRYCSGDEGRRTSGVAAAAHRQGTACGTVPALLERVDWSYEESVAFAGGPIRVSCGSVPREREI